MIRRHPTLIGATLLGLMAGCATDALPDRASHVTGATFRDTSALTVFIADILATSMDPGQSTLRLSPFEGADEAHAQTLLSDTLRERGFALSPDGMPYPGAHTVRYSISAVGLNLLLELDVDDAAATCLYGHAADGALIRTGSCTLRAGASLAMRIPAQPELHTVEPNIRGVNVSPLPAPARTGAALPIHEAPISRQPQPTTAPPAAPLRLQPPAEIWTLVEGQPIRDQMIAWADRAGWKVEWPHELNWNVPALTTFTGDFHTVMSDVVRTIADEGKSIRAEFHSSNRFLVVTSPGGQGR